MRRTLKTVMKKPRNVVGVITAIVCIYILIIPVVARDSPHPSVTRHMAARFPSLNEPGADTWVVPSERKKGVGYYENNRTGLQIKVLHVYIGTFTGDDACSQRRINAVGLPDYYALVTMLISNTGTTKLSLKQDDFSVEIVGDVSRTGVWGPLPSQTVLYPGQRTQALVAFYNFPRRGGVYRFSYISDRSGLIGAYDVDSKGVSSCPVG